MLSGYNEWQSIGHYGTKPQKQNKCRMTKWKQSPTSVLKMDTHVADKNYWEPESESADIREVSLQQPLL